MNKNVSIAVKIALACLAGLICASCGPRMRVQPSIQPYERKMPPMPEGMVPTTGRLETLTDQQANLLKNPLPDTPTNRKNGEIYYGYYCMMCHGVKGDGNGPVGEGYVPKPADLSSPSIAKLSDGALYYRMLHGVGHDPVMMQTVPPEHRWPLVLYVREFGASQIHSENGLQ